MVAYRKVEEMDQPQSRRNALSHDLLHGMTPEQFDGEAADLSSIQGMSGAMRERLHAQLSERLKTSVDKPSWGPDWVRHGDRNAPRRKGRRRGLLGLLMPSRGKDAKDEPERALSPEQQDDAHVIARNMEKSRQVWGYRNLYVLGAIVAITIAALAMFVDYQIIRGDVWTRALSNEFMVVPASLQSSVIFKSMQVIFAVLIVHFMLKITGVYGRNALISTAFVFAIVMICCLGYLVAYNNMAGGTSTTLEHTGDDAAQSSGGNSIDQLLGTPGAKSSGLQSASETRVTPAVETKDVSFSIPKISQLSLANADSWFWLAFASVIFFIVTTVAALYIQTFENNVRNFLIARDYKHRQRQFAQLHLIDLADKRSA